MYENASAAAYVCSSSGRGRSEWFGAEPCTVRQLCTVIVPAGPTGYTARVDAGAVDVGVGERADPDVAVVEVEQRAVVAPGYEPDLTHAGLDVVEEHADRQEVVVGVGPELDVLVPLHLFTAVRAP